MYQTKYILKKCLQNIYDSNPNLYQPKYRLDNPKEIQLLENNNDERTLIQHDSQHFVFGCGTHIEGELALQINVLFLADMKWRTILATYNDGLGADEAVKDGIKAFVKLGLLGAIVRIFRLIVHLILTIFKRFKFILRKRKLFPFSKTHQMLNMTIDQIRTEYDIKPYNQI